MAKRCEADLEDQLEERRLIDTTILDVNDDCLFEIFKFLKLNDLLSVRATNSKFKTSTERAFVRKQRDTPLGVSNHDTNRELSFNILKQFGQFVRKLCVCYKMEKFDLLMQAIVEHCGDSVTELEFHHEKEEWYLGLHRTAVRRIKRQLHDLGAKFPKLHKLTFEYNDFVDCPYSDDIIQTIPTLTVFSASGVMFSHEDVCKLMSLNGQLERLELCVPNGVISQRFIDKIDAALPKLTALSIYNVQIENTLDDPINSVKFTNLKELTFGRVSSAYSIYVLVPLFNANINSLTLYCENYFIANFVEIISSRFKKLTQFTVRLVSKSIPSMAEFDTSIVSSNAIKELILANNQLTEISIIWHHSLKDLHIYIRKYCDAIKEKLNGVQWKAYTYTWSEENLTHISFEI